MLNKIILIGRLARDPELRYTPSGTPVAGFTVAVDRPFVDKQGNRGTDFIDVVSTGSAPGNFSKAKRGTLVTT